MLHAKTDDGYFMVVFDDVKNTYAKYDISTRNDPDTAVYGCISCKSFYDSLPRYLVVPEFMRGILSGANIGHAEVDPHYSFTVDGITCTLKPDPLLTAYELYNIGVWKEWVGLNRWVTPERMLEKARDMAILRHFKQS